MVEHAENDTEALLVQEDPGEVTSTRRHWRVVAALACVCGVGLIGVTKLPVQSPVPAVHGATYDVTELLEVSEHADEFQKEMVDDIPIYTDQGTIQVKAAGRRKVQEWVLNFLPETTDEKVKAAADNFGDKVVYVGASSGFIVVRGTLKELREMLKDHTEQIDFVEQDVKSIAIPEMGEGRRLDPTSSWGVDRVDQRNLPLDDDYGLSGKGKGAHVYVFDTGINVEHRDFDGRAIPTLEVIGQGARACDATDTKCANDVNGHGTHCAGTIGGHDYGVAKGATIHAVKILSDQGQGSMSWMEMAFDWLLQNKETPAIVSASLGGYGQVQSTKHVIDVAVNKGITVVVAAGNENSNACSFTPAYIPSAITVGSTDRKDVRSGFSNYGNCLDIFAPGSHIVSAGLGKGDSATLSGTSMACPHVSGAAAVLLAKSPSMTPKQVVQRLTEHATLDVVHGHGEGSPDKLLYVGTGDDEPPVDTPAPAPPDDDTCQSLGWQVMKGDCKIDENCCLTSPNYPDNYGADQTCFIEVGSDPGPIEQRRFQTEGWWDTFELKTFAGSQHFSGSTGPHDEIPYGEIRFTSDGSINKRGFKLCLPRRGECPKNGWKKASHCQETFSYRGVEYSGCSTVDHDGGWCQVSKSGRYIRWADCIQCK